MSARCQTCGRSTAPGLFASLLRNPPGHKCPPAWLVWCPDQGVEEEDASTYHTDDVETAATDYASASDDESNLCENHDGILVFVRRVGENTVHRVRVRAEAVIAYHATEEDA